MTAPLVVGLDLSLASTGIAHMRGLDVVTDTITPPKERTGLLRLRWLRTVLADHTATAALVVLEGPAYGMSSGQGYHERAGLHWMLLDALWRRSIPVAIVTPQHAKQYATGKGNAGKDAMILAAARRYASFTGDNNAADALWLAALGTDHLTGISVVPAIVAQAVSA
jgi:hypothetical protein